MSEADKGEAYAPHNGMQDSTCHDFPRSKLSELYELAGASSGSDVWSESDEDGSGSSVREGGHGSSETHSVAPSVGARSSIASTYWRAERHDRKPGMALIDEQ